MALKYLTILTLLLTVLHAQDDAFYTAIDAYYDTNSSNDGQAIATLKRFAEHGNSDAAFLLALSYEKGTHTNTSAPQALYWYEVAANLGDVDAMSVTAWFYYNGIGTKADEKKARHWFEKAANLNDEEAKAMLKTLTE